MMSDAAVASHRTGIAGAVRRLYAGLEAFPLSVVEVMMRIGVGAVFFKSGLTKIANMEIAVDLFREEYKMPLLPPEVAAPLATAAELTAPVLLFVGLLTRPAATALLGMTAVIQLFVYPANWSEHLLWASILIYLLTRGPGSLSVDHLVRRSIE